MMSMTRRVTLAIRQDRRTGPLIAAGVLGLLLAFTALPLCTGAFICTMACCEFASEPADEHGAMPGEACGHASTRCAAATVIGDLETILVSHLHSPQILSSAVAGLFASDAASPTHVRAQVDRVSSTVQRLYILNDVFLI